MLLARFPAMYGPHQSKPGKNFFYGKLQLL